MSRAKIGILTTYNQRCGLATYIEHLLQRFSAEDVVILAEDVSEQGKFRPDSDNVVRCWHRTSGDYRRIIRAAEKYKLDLLHINCQAAFFVPGLFPRCLAELRARGIKVITEFHNIGSAYDAIREMIKESDLVVVHLPQNRLEAMANGASAKQVEVIEHGVELVANMDQQAARRRLGITLDQTIIASFGFIREHKGFGDLLPAPRALAKYIPNLHLYIIGECHEEESDSRVYLDRLKTRTRDLNVVERVHFITEFLPLAAVQDYLVAADLVVMNYKHKDYEASGATAVAMGCGAAIITSTAPCFHHLGDAVFRYTREEINQGFFLLGSVLLVLRERELQHELRQRARAWAEAHCWENTAVRFAELYQRLCGKPVRLLEDARETSYQSAKTADDKSISTRGEIMPMNNGQAKAVFFTCSNENQVKLFMPVARQLRQIGYSPVFVSLDNYYRQKASSLLRSLDMEWTELPCSLPASEWWDLAETQREPLLREAWRALDQLFAARRPAVSVVGNDYGAVEQLSIRAAELYAARTVWIQDGIVHIPPLRPNQRIEPVSLADGGCELVCLWCDRLSNNARNRGIGSEIVTSGNPRYDVLAGQPLYRPHAGPYTVMIAVQCFSKYGLLTVAQEISVYERIARQLLERPDVSVLIKLHPQTAAVDCYQRLAERLGSRVTVISEGDSLAVLEKIDALFTISSTVSIESTAMGIPTRRLMSYVSKDAEMFAAKDAEFEAQIKSTDFPRSISLESMSRAEFLRMFLRDIDGLATERIASAIKDLADKKVIRTEAPLMTMLLESADQTPIAAIRSLLRPGSPGVEILFVDRSVQGDHFRRIEDDISDPRVRLMHIPRTSQSAAVRAALGECRTDLVLRFDSGCIALPGMLERFRRAFELRPDAAVLLSSSGWRNRVGVVEQLQILESNQSLNDLLKDPMAHNALLAYGFRCDPRLLANELANIDENIDLQLIARLVRDFDNPRRIVTLPGIGFLSPWANG